MPYARCDIIHGKLVRICPACGEKCHERTDGEGEQITGTYQEHWEKWHSKKSHPVHEVLQQEVVQ